MEEKKVKVSLVIVLGLLAAFGPLSLDMYLPALPGVADDLSTSASTAQLSLTACLIGLALGQVLVGPLSDITGRKKPLIIVLIVYAIASLLCAFADHIVLLIVLRFIQGASGGAGAVISRAISSDMYQGKALTKFLSMLMLVNGLAPILAPVVGGVILSFSTWHMVFYILAGYGVLMVMLSLPLEETLPTEARREGAFAVIVHDFKALFRNRRFLIMLLLQSLTYGVLFSYISASPFITQKIFHLSAQQFSYMFAANGVGLIIASQLTAKLIDRYDEFTILKWGQLVQLIGMLLTAAVLLLHLPVWLLFIAFFLLIAPVSMIGTTGFSIAMQVQQQGAGSASSILGLMQFMIGALLSPLVGLMGETSVLPFIVIIFICTVTAQLVRAVNRKYFMDLIQDS